MGDLKSCNVEHYGITTAHMATAFRKLLNVAITPCVDMPESLSGTRRFEVLAGLIDAPMKCDVDTPNEVPKLDAETMSGKVVISSDSHCDEATAVVFLLKLKLSLNSVRVDSDVTAQHLTSTLEKKMKAG